MGKLSAKLRSVASSTPGGECVAFWCPGCDSAHVVRVAGPDPWGYNGNVDAPTFTPSILVSYNGSDAGKDGAPPAICHSFVTDGVMDFLADCTHAMAGQKALIPDWPDNDFYMRSSS